MAYDSNIEINRKIAYKGRIGRLRESFCTAHIRQKQEAYGEIRKEQVRRAAENGETITCHRGCAFCCSLYVEADIQECEAIVYYLYQNEDILANFLENYPEWREKMRQKGDLFNISQQIWQEASFLVYGEGLQQAFTEETGGEGIEEMLCPFLKEDLCSIYQVRPYVCAAFSATTPARWCSPYYSRVPKIYRIMPERLKIPDLSFCYKGLSSPFISSMPLSIYEILKNGVSYLSTIPGLDGLKNEFLDDDEVRGILKEYG